MDLAQARRVEAQGPQDWRRLDERGSSRFEPVLLLLWCWTGAAGVNAGWSWWRSHAQSLRTEESLFNRPKKQLSLIILFVLP